MFLCQQHTWETKRNAERVYWRIKSMKSAKSRAAISLAIHTHSDLILNGQPFCVNDSCSSVVKTDRPFNQQPRWQKTWWRHHNKSTCTHQPNQQNNNDRLLGIRFDHAWVRLDVIFASTPSSHPINVYASEWRWKDATFVQTLGFTIIIQMLWMLPQEISIYHVTSIDVYHPLRLDVVLTLRTPR